MSAAVRVEPQILHALPGRIRAHLDGWAGGDQQGVKRHLLNFPGIRSVEARGLTGNVLIQFDPQQIGANEILEALKELPVQVAASEEASPPPKSLPPAHHERQQGLQRARIAIRGLDRDLALGKWVEALLEREFNVSARASPLTGRVLVEWADPAISLEEIVSTISETELEPLEDEERPDHPLAPEPLTQGIADVSGAAIGIAILAARRLLGQSGAPIASAVPVYVGDLIGILRGIPVIQDGMRRILGPSLADGVFRAAGNMSHTMSGNALGLAVHGSEGLRGYTEVTNRRTEWQNYELRTRKNPRLEPGSLVHSEAGERLMFGAEVQRGLGVAIGDDGLPLHIGPGSSLPPGALLLSGGPFDLRIEELSPITPDFSGAIAEIPFLQRYRKLGGFGAIGYALVMGVATRSLSRAFESLLLVSPRIALVGADAADQGASARLMRAGITVVGTRRQRPFRRPDWLVLGSPRLLTSQLEICDVLALHDDLDEARVRDLAASISAAADDPWGTVIRRSRSTLQMSAGRFNGTSARAELGERTYVLAPLDAQQDLETADYSRPAGTYVLVLRELGVDQALGMVMLRPRLAPGVDEVVGLAQNYGTRIAALARADSPAAREICKRAGVEFLAGEDALAVVERLRATGSYVAFVSDEGSTTAAAFFASDVGVAIAPHDVEFPVRVDLIAPDILSLGAILETGVRRDQSAQAATWLSLAANAFGIAWGILRQPYIGRLTNITNVGSLAAMALAWFRLRGESKSRRSAIRVVDPQPEKWGQRGIQEVFDILRTSVTGLTGHEASSRWQERTELSSSPRLLDALLEQAKSPLIGIMAAGGIFSFLIGNVIDVAIIGVTILTNVVIGAWQEHQADQTVEALREMGTPTARVLRDGEETEIPATDLVPGDVLVLAWGDRIGADARIIEAEGFEVDEASLTGESLPVAKDPDSASPERCIVLEGSDVTAGTARAVVFAVGYATRMGATEAALAVDDSRESPLNRRLTQMLRYALPVSGGAGALVFLSGLIRGFAPQQQLAVAGSLAIAAVPEGLPLLARLGEANVARRMAEHGALVRRLSSVEALGRVDVACADKTGTLTEGNLKLGVVSAFDEEVVLPGALPVSLEYVLTTAALASPHPEAGDASVHATDAAVINGALDAGLNDSIVVERLAVAAFDAVRGFHAALADDRLCVKGAPETVIDFCTRIRTRDGDVDVNGVKRSRFIEQSEELADQGYRVLLVAEGGSSTQAEEPTDLTALGFIGIRDPLRATVPAAIRRCHEAGIRVVMITGDHPRTASAIAREAGLMVENGRILTGTEILELSDLDLDHRLDHAVIIARATPLDKLRIIESLQRRGHVVAMTGDGVNDAPALRLADVGVAMGQGTEVARQAADVVLADDDFSALVEILVEGRSFWQNIRRSVSLLLGGNLGELGLMAVPAVFTGNAPLNTRQILVVNMISDVLPALAIALQGPEHRNLHSLGREGEAALEGKLKRDIVRRGASTALPAIAAFGGAMALGLPGAGTVGFASIVSTQLAQTLDLGWSEGRLSPSVLVAVAASAGLLVSATIFPPLQMILQLAPLPPVGWLLVGLASVGAVALSRLLFAIKIGDDHVEVQSLPQGEIPLGLPSGASI